MSPARPIALYVMLGSQLMGKALCLVYPLQRILLVRTVNIGRTLSAVHPVQLVLTLTKPPSSNAKLVQQGMNRFTKVPATVPSALQ
jgi:hypothetical protein